MGSKIEQLQDKKAELEARAQELQERGDEWTEKKAAATEELKAAVLEDKATFQRSSAVREAELALDAIAEAYGDTQRRIEALDEEIINRRYEVGRDRLERLRAKTEQEMVESNQRLIEAVQREWEEQLGLTASFNAKAASFNQRLANRALRDRVEQIDRLSHYTLDEFVRVLVRTFLLEGDEGISDPIMPLPLNSRTEQMNVEFPGLRRVE